MHPRTKSWFIGRMLIHEIDDRMAELLNLEVYANDYNEWIVKSVTQLHKAGSWMYMLKGAKETDHLHHH